MNKRYSVLAYKIRNVRQEPNGDIRTLCEIAGISILDVLAGSDHSEVTLWEGEGTGRREDSSYSSSQLAVLGSEEEFMSFVELQKNDPVQLVWLSAIARRRGFYSISHYSSTLALRKNPDARNRDDAGAIASLFVAVKEGDLKLTIVEEFLDETLNLPGAMVRRLFEHFARETGRKSHERVEQ